MTARPRIRRATTTALAALLLSAPPLAAQDFDVVEATIAEIHEAMAEGRLTARQLVEAYLARIEAYDRQGPSLNSLIVVNPGALARADSLDAAFRRAGELTGPLHGIPVIVKDNYDTHDLPTTAGSLTLAGSIPPDDAFQVARIREAGAIVLAKSNMAEFAFTPYETVGSMLPGYTRNPYDTRYGTAGSSGGTAAAVAASLGAVGLGTDTGNSIRGPSSHQALVGIRSTLGLTSRGGIVPLYLDRDVGGPMARTVADAARVLDVIAGSDPEDPATAEADARRERSYTEHLQRDALRGARIGVVRALSNTETADPEVLERFDAALRDLEAAGATLVDPAEIPGWEEIQRAPLFCSRFRKDIEDYLATLGDDAPVRTLEEIRRRGDVHPSIEGRIDYFLENAAAPDTEQCRRAAANAERLRGAVRELMAAERLDALVYPTWANPPRLIGDLNTPHGNNSWQISPPTGFPAITVPMGYVRDGLPVGLQLLGDAWSEGRLIGLAYAYEQATRHRRPPPTTPSLRPSADAGTAAGAEPGAADATNAAAAAAAAADAVEPGTTVIYLVRHAETEDDGTGDPALSATGRERAARLAGMLEGAGLTAIHTTPYQRTRGTARAVAEATGPTPRDYDPRDLEGFAARLRAAGGRHLVVGHSNTTPALVQRLGGDPGGPIREHEHDRVYLLVVERDGTVRTTLLGYPGEGGEGSASR